MTNFNDAAAREWAEKKAHVDVEHWILGVGSTSESSPLVKFHPDDLKRLHAVALREAHQLGRKEQRVEIAATMAGLFLLPTGEEVPEDDTSFAAEFTRELLKMHREAAARAVEEFKASHPVLKSMKWIDEEPDIYSEEG